MMASNSSDCLMGFIRYALTPNCRQRTMSRDWSADESINREARANSGCCLICSIRVKPSISGISASASTRANGSPEAAARFISASAARPSATALGFMCHLVRISSRIRRLVALSSTTSTGRSRTTGRLDDRLRRLRVFLHAQPHGEVERAPPADLALDPDSPPHQRDQLGRNRQAQPGAAILPGRGAIGLGERLENQALPLPGNADPRVGHPEVKADLVLASATPSRRGRSLRRSR